MPHSLFLGIDNAIHEQQCADNPRASTWQLVGSFDHVAGAVALWVLSRCRHCLKSFLVNKVGLLRDANSKQFLEAALE